MEDAPADFKSRALVNRLHAYENIVRNDYCNVIYVTASDIFDAVNMENISPQTKIYAIMAMTELNYINENFTFFENQIKYLPYYQQLLNMPESTKKQK